MGKVDKEEGSWSPASPDFGDLGYNLCKAAKHLELTLEPGRA